MAPGETTDYPVLLTGWSPVNHAADVGPLPPDEPAARPRTKKTTTAAADYEGKGGEPR